MSHERNYPYTIYFWKIRDERTGKMRKTRSRMSEEYAKAHHPEAERIDWDRMVIDGAAEMINTGMFPAARAANSA
jgi:hypothetical protein